MAVIRCSKGHYYDDTKFAQCPHCGVLPAVEPEKPAKAKKFGFFRKEAPAKQQVTPVTPVHTQGSGQQPPNGGISYNAPAVQPFDDENDDRTIGLGSQPIGSGYGDDDNRTIAFGQPSGGGSYGDDDNRTIAFGTSAGGSGYSDDDNRTIAFGTSTGGSGYSDDDNRTIAFGQNIGGSSINEDDNRTIAFGRNAGGSSINEDDNRTIAFGRNAGGSSINEDENRTIAFGRNAGGSSINEDENRTIAYGRTTGGSSINEDDNRTIAYGRTTGGSSINEDENRTIAFSRPDGGNKAAGQEAKAGGNGSISQPSAKPEAPVKSPAPAVKAQQVSAAVQEGNLPLSPEQYVAGWLVCVKGERKGKDYRLYKGFNRMGGRQNADIPLPEELKDTVCALVYDDRGNRFYLVQQSGDPVYLNDEAIKGSMEIHTGDRIKAGESNMSLSRFAGKEKHGIFKREHKGFHHVAAHLLPGA